MKTKGRLKEAEDLAKYDQKLAIYGSDIDHRMVEMSKQNAAEIGLYDVISWKQMQLKDLRIKEPNGYLISNPPYGERLEDREYVESLYQTLGDIMRNHPSWSVYILTSHKQFERLYGKKSDEKGENYSTVSLKRNIINISGKKHDAPSSKTSRLGQNSANE